MTANGSSQENRLERTSPWFSEQGPPCSTLFDRRKRHMFYRFPNQKRQERLISVQGLFSNDVTDDI